MRKHRARTSGEQPSPGNSNAPVPLVRSFSNGQFPTMGVDPNGGTVHVSSQPPDAASGSGLLDDPVSAVLRSEFLKKRYELLELLGEGGMGTVYKARYIGSPNVFGISHGATVAIKLLSEKYVRRHVERTRFYDEGGILIKIDHPNLVKVFQVTELCNRPFYVMEYLEGTNLGSYLALKGKLEVSKTLRIARAACAGLAVAHSSGIIHRDVKPDNIFIVDVDGEERVKLIDLGIAKFMDLIHARGLTDTDMTLGTVTHMAPEMIAESNEHVEFDHRIDIYALGVTMYEVICGSLPFEGNTVPETMYLHKFGTLQPIRERVPDLAIPENVERLVMKVLARDPNERFQSMGELIEAIDGCGILDESVPLLSLPPSKAYTPPVAPVSISELPTQVMPRQEMPTKPKDAEKAERKTGRKWLVPAAVVACLTAGGILISRMINPILPAEQPPGETQLPSEKPAIPDQIYSAHIETDVPGVQIILEEKLEGGGVARRPLGETGEKDPLLLRGEKTIVLEKPGYETVYLKISPDNSNVAHKMKKIR